jgi:glucose-1-phosphate cytidylyltransferase
MKVVILAGGLGTRLAEETETKPKPMVEIGGRPILWHIMMHYARHGFDDFVIALGYKGDLIKRYFVDYLSLQDDITVDFKARTVKTADIRRHTWRVSLVDTGAATMTGGRLKRLRAHLGDGTFMMTYGDGVSNVPLDTLLQFHNTHGRLATLTAVRPIARFGQLDLNEDQVAHFEEKPQTHEGWINGGFFVLEPRVLDFIDGDATFFEKEPLTQLSRAAQLMAYRHEGFWQCMDTLRDKLNLDKMWQNGDPPWKTWHDDA